MNNNRQVSDQIPLSEATFFILLSLADAPKHGYAIMKDVADLSRDRLQLSTGTLYGAIKRLLEDGWIHLVKEIRADDYSRYRKVYGLTEKGRKVLQADYKRLRSILAISSNQLEGRLNES